MNDVIIALKGKSIKKDNCILQILFVPIQCGMEIAQNKNQLYCL